MTRMRTIISLIATAVLALSSSLSPTGQAAVGDCRHPPWRAHDSPHPAARSSLRSCPGGDSAQDAAIARRTGSGQRPVVFRNDPSYIQQQRRLELRVLHRVQVGMECWHPLLAIWEQECQKQLETQQLERISHSSTSFPQYSWVHPAESTSIYAVASQWNSKKRWVLRKISQRHMASNLQPELQYL